MILIDTSIWIDHFRVPEGGVLTLLAAEDVLVHPFVIGEVMLGNMRGRQQIAAMMRLLPAAEVASYEEILSFITVNRLGGTGIGYVDAHLLAAIKLTTGSRLWSRDKRLARVAEELGIAYGG